MPAPKKGVAYSFDITLFDAATPGRLKSNPTLTTGDFKLVKDNGTPTDLATLPTVTPTGGVIVSVSLSASEMTGDKLSVIGSDPDFEWSDTHWYLDTTTQTIEDVPTAIQTADAMLDRASGIESGLTPRNAWRLIVAACAGLASGLATTTALYKSADISGGAVQGTKTRITATVDADGNRSAITTDLS